MRVLLVTPPMVQFNAPYAATPLLTGFLKSRGVDVRQADLSLELALTIFSRAGLERIAGVLESSGETRRLPAVYGFLRNKQRYLETVDEVISFLQRGDSASAEKIMDDGWLPQGPRFCVIGELHAHGRWPFTKDVQALARYRASLYVDDLADVIRDGVDKRFGLSRYAEQLGLSAASFTPLLRQFTRQPGTLIDQWLDGLVDDMMKTHQPDLVGLTIPFPGNVYSAFRMARRIKNQTPEIRIAAGGGFVNTEWRALSDVRVFNVLDYLLYDDGEIPLCRLLDHLDGKISVDGLVRTRMRREGKVVWIDNAEEPPLKHRDRAAPCYEGLDLTRYCSITESTNPMHRLWTEHGWMKLMLAHGCYWHRCAFCDTTLGYIACYDPAPAERIADWIETVIKETGRRTFHFVDEAAPPALLRRLSECLIARKLDLQWWTNIRFEKAFDEDLCRLLAKAGCVAVTGGMECAEERLITLMNKGIRLRDMVRAAYAFSRAGVLVHAYLMYGFPTQTPQEVVDALDYVRQLFQSGCVQSAYWHRFALTVHSPIYAAPKSFRLTPQRPAHRGFSENGIPYSEWKPRHEEGIGEALHTAVYNYMHGVALDEPVQAWFSEPMPAPRLARDAVKRWAAEP